jgi:hypothetical protein
MRIARPRKSLIEDEGTKTIKMISTSNSTKINKIKKKCMEKGVNPPKYPINPDSTG